MFDVIDMERPVIKCILAIRLPDGEYLVTKETTVSLEDAADYARFGWEVIRDPETVEALARYEQIERSRQHKPKWTRW